MNGAEKILKLMRDQSNLNSANTIRIGMMTAKKKCKVGDLTLDEEDLMVNEPLKGKLAKDDEVILFQIDDVFYILAKVVDL